MTRLLRYLSTIVMATMVFATPHSKPYKVISGAVVPCMVTDATGPKDSKITLTGNAQFIAGNGAFNLTEIPSRYHIALCWDEACDRGYVLSDKTVNEWYNNKSCNCISNPNQKASQGCASYIKLTNSKSLSSDLKCTVTSPIKEGNKGDSKAGGDAGVVEGGGVGARSTTHEEDALSPVVL